MKFTIKFITVIYRIRKGSVNQLTVLQFSLLPLKSQSFFTACCLYHVTNQRQLHCHSQILSKVSMVCTFQNQKKYVFWVLYA